MGNTETTQLCKVLARPKKVQWIISLQGKAIIDFDWDQNRMDMISYIKVTVNAIE
jgi:hypothetical protein